MKIGIIGTGGVGGYFGGKLAQNGNKVTFIARGEHLHAIIKNGLYIKSINGNIHIKPAVVSNELSALSQSELIIICTKAWQVSDIAKELKKYIHENTLLLPIQNGVLATNELMEHIPKNQVLGGLCMIFSHIEAPGIINHLGYEPTIVFGELDKKLTGRAKLIQSVFEKSEFKCNLTDDIEASLWKKFILICLSGLGAISNAGYGLIRELKESRDLMVDIMTEIYDISKAKRINLRDDIIERSMAAVDKYPYDAMSSLSRDVLSGKSSEIEYQNGTVVKLGEELGIATPANKFVYTMIKLIEQQKQK